VSYLPRRDVGSQLDTGLRKAPTDTFPHHQQEPHS